MDFMKVFDQTVREIKREVNLKVLKVPEIEQKVLDATDDEPWGPHGAVLAEIAQATKKFSECQMVMSVLWTRVGETGRNWRYVYKALAVIEYLVANGSERAVDEIIEHTFQISSLTSFEYVEPSGKDFGINVRKKAENIASLLNDKDKIQEVRDKAATNRDKYFGLSSSGVTYKLGAASSSGSDFRSSDRYGGFQSTRDGDTFRDSYKDKDDENKFDHDTKAMSRQGTSDNLGKIKIKASSRSKSKPPGNVSVNGSKQTTKASEADKHSSIPSKTSTLPLDDDFDDFDPRGTSTSKSTGGSAGQVDLFGQDLISDLLDAPVPVSTNAPIVNGASSEVDLFADASFVSASTPADSGETSIGQVDLFASHPMSSSAAPSSMDFFSMPDPVVQPENTTTKAGVSTTNSADPFAALPLNNFDGSGLFGAFTSNTDAIFKGPTKDPFGAISSDLNEKSPVESKPASKKENFQVKSGIWADSLSRGIIDLNISAPKKVNLADVGIMGGWSDGSDEKDKGPSAAFFRGRSMGAGSGINPAGFGFTSTAASMGADDFFSSLSSQQNQFGGFKK